MKRPLKLLGVALCSLSITVAGNALATSEETLIYGDEQPNRSVDEKEGEKFCRVFFIKDNFSVQVASLDPGEPVNTFHMFVTDHDGKIVKNAQVVATIIDKDGGQQLSRAIPYKGGYILAIDHLAAGEYLVEAEILAKNQLMVDMFRFNKA